MSFFNKKKNSENKNRLRLQKLIDLTTTKDTPNGWVKKTFAIGGLSDVGFSKKNTELLLIVSSQGRGIIDCSKLELIERDNNDDFDWLNPYKLLADGFGTLANEKIFISGLSGGGLPTSNQFGDNIEYMATEWPIISLIFEPNYKSIYKEGEEKYCFKIFHDYELRAYGFSSDGTYFVTATSSEINIYKKKN